LEQNLISEKTQEKQILLTFQDNKLLPMLFGDQDKNLARLEEKMGVSTSSRGNTVAISGKEPEISKAKEILQGLYGKLEKGIDLTSSDFDAAIRLSISDITLLKSKKEELKANYRDIVIRTQKKHITPYSHTQAEYIKSLFEFSVMIGRLLRILLCGQSGLPKLKRKFFPDRNLPLLFYP
jgi:phosphate starvation-inducible protein PhoH and related proteins